MSKLQKFLAVVLILVIFGSVGAGLIWHTQHYVMINYQFYPKDADVLDLRGEAISISEYKRFHRRLPNCEILWDVPFQGKTYPQDTKELTVTSLTEADVDTLECFSDLESVQAEGCTDYEQLMLLQNRYPELTLTYSVLLGGKAYDREAYELELESIGSDEIRRLKCMPNLQTVVAGGGEAEALTQLRKYCHDKGLSFSLSVGGEIVSDTVQSLTVNSITEAELGLLALLPDLKTLHLVTPEASAKSVLQLRSDYPRVSITWEQSIGGKLYADETVEIDLSDAQIVSLQQVEEAMAYFPEAKSVFLGQCGLEDDLIADYRERSRGQYKVVWTVDFGGKLPTRTDATTFYPTGVGIYYFSDEEAKDLNYCEDMVCIDMGHMSISDVSFLKYMPNLEYLILAHTQVQHLEGIEYCKKLKYLELDWSPVKDYTPLAGCTALEDLNIGKTYAKIDPILEMTWLKNLWMIGCVGVNAYTATQTMPDTHVVASGTITVGGGWRNLDNYYAMRDLLGAEYMRG